MTYSIAKDINGNKVCRIRNIGNAFSIQTLGNMPRTHRDGIGAWTEGEVRAHVLAYGTPRQKAMFDADDTADAHTPAPWLLAETSGFVYALNDDGTNRFHFSIQAGHTQQSRHTSIRTSAEEVNANAKLIAAAPELLDALRAAQMALFGFVTRNEEVQRALNMTSAAIAKATK